MNFYKYFLMLIWYYYMFKNMYLIVKRVDCMKKRVFLYYYN